MEHIGDKLIGKTADEATGICFEFGYTTRIVREDFKLYVVTQDFRLDRVNLELENGVVVAAHIG